MKVFVGTLYCKENDYDEHTKAINDQENVTVTHHTICNMPEREAHNCLWDSWESAKKDHDLFVKIDADTVLAHNNVLHDICKLFNDEPRLTGVQCYLHDYFTNELIYGLNCFSKKVTFARLDDKLYCDRADGNHDIVIRGNALPSTLIPAGFHCYHANDVQAFHYGLHRALKNQTNVIQSVIKTWQVKKDRLRGLAIEGFKAAESFRNDSKSFNYNDNTFLVAYAAAVDAYEKLS